MNIKKALIIGIASITLMSQITPAFAMGSSNNIVIVKNEVTLTAEPYLLDDQIMIPVRSFAKSQGCKVVWDGKRKTDTITKDGKLLYKIQINSNIAILKGKIYQLLNPVVLKDGRIFVEADFLNLMHKTKLELFSTAITQRDYEFNNGDSGFKAIFSDYSYNTEGNYDIYEMVSDYKNIPVTDNGSMGLYLASHNRSDDLFMGYAKEISGLTPNTEYSLRINFQLATNVESGGFGIGGSPSSSVYVKCGASTIEPLSILNEEKSMYRMNIDIGEQSQGGKDMQVIGDIGKPETSEIAGFVYKDMQMDFKVVTDENGSYYLIIGTDSGYEGFTEFYIDNMTINCSKE